MRSPTHIDGVRPPTDHGVDRPGMHTRQRAQWTGTNRPRTYPKTPSTHSSKHHTTKPRIHYPVHRPSPDTPRETQPDNVAAAMAAGKRPDPFRTRKLSPPAPRVLPGRPGGRAGHRRTTRNTPRPRPVTNRTGPRGISTPISREPAVSESTQPVHGKGTTRGPRADLAGMRPSRTFRPRPGYHQPGRPAHSSSRSSSSSMSPSSEKSPSKSIARRASASRTPHSISWSTNTDG